MKIDKLSIDGFGHFREYEVTLSSGLNLLAGGNEAGKSTLLAFIRGVLFGFERRASANRYEPEGGGTFGGDLRLSSRLGPLWVRREGKRRVEGELSVRDDQGNPLPERHLDEALAGISKELFFQVFAFGLQELVSFEQLASSGSVAEALFAAGMQGAQRLPGAVQTLRSSADALFKPSGRNPRINVLLTELGKKQARIAEIGNRPEEYGAARARVQQLEQEAALVESRLDEVGTERARWARLHAAVADLAAWMALKREVDATPELASFPAGGVPRLEELLRRLDQGNEERAATRSSLDSVRRQLGWLARAAHLKGQEPQLLAALETFRSRSEVLQGLAGRAASLGEQQRQIEAGVRALGLKLDIGALRTVDVGAGSKAAISRLRDQWLEKERVLSARVEALRVATSARVAAEAEVRRLSTEIGALPDARLSAVRQALNEVDRFERERTERERVAEGLAEKRSSLQRVLTPTEPVPPVAFPAWMLALTVLMLSGLSGLNLWLNGLRTGWPALAASVMMALLATVLQRRASRSHVAAKRAAQARETFRVSEMDRLRKDLAQLEHREAELAQRVREAATAAGLEKDAEPRAVSARREFLEEQLTAIERRERLAHDMESMSARLALAAHAEREAQADRDVSEAALSRLSRELDECVLPKGFPSGLTPSQALDLWVEVSGQQQRLWELDAAQKAWAEDTARCEEATAGVVEAAQRAGVDEAANLGPEGAASALATVLKQGREAQEQRQQLELQQQQLEDQLQNLQRSGQSVEEAVSALLAQGQSTDPEDFRLRAELAERYRKASEELRQRAARVHAATALEPEAASVQLGQCGGEPGLQATVDRLNEQMELLALRRREAAQEVGSLKQRISDWEADGELAALRQQEESLSAQIQELSHQYAVERVALALLHRARRRLEREHQPRVVQLASSIFEELTGGRYPRVFASVDGSRDLRILDLAQREWSAQQLSRGTREQLYLAFRLAVIEDFGETKAPLPIIIDDIMVNFDPERTRLTLKVLGRLSRRHQVIAFTCHPGQKELFEAQGAKVIDVGLRKQLSLISA